MGAFYVRIEVGDPAGARFEPLQALVDTGATYLQVPSPVLQSLGVQPVETRRFVLADGRAVESEVGVVSLRLEGRTFPSLCVFAEPASEPLLGAAPLETFMLAPDPVGRRLVPVPGLRMERRPARITRADVEHVAMLARLGLTEEEKTLLQGQLSAILEYMQALGELDTSAIPPTAQVIPLQNVMRPDEPRPSLPVEEVLANAPDQEDGFIRFPPVLE